jgi:hypothetical protein
MRKTPLVLLVAAILGMTTVSHAGVDIIDYQGYAWETGGFVPSNVNDVLNIVGITDNIDAVFGIDLNIEEVTIHATGLVSTGQVPLGGGVIAVSYAGGTLQVWQDPAMNHDYGINPANATAPSTFIDGALLFGGFFTNFVLYFDTVNGVGSYEGNVTWTAGSGLAMYQNNGFTFGGVLNSAASSGSVPQGYDLQADGIIEVNPIIAVEDKTWSGVKSLYNK